MLCMFLRDAGIQMTHMAILELMSLGKNFGQNVAVNSLDMTVEEGEIRGLIGPNGSGKTTIFNLITGFLKPSKGRIIWRGNDITASPPHAVAKLGLARTFQLTTLFRDMTVLQNVIMAHHLHLRASLWHQFLKSAECRQEEKEIEDMSLALLERMGIATRKDEIAGELPHGYQVALGIANALASGPKILLLDEPVGGMNPVETDETMQRIRSVRDQGITVFLVEHDMRAVVSTCDKITCINFGNKIAEGSPQMVCSHPEVIEAYLGEEVSCSL